MTKNNALNTLPDDTLLNRLAELVRSSRVVEADLIAHIAEVDARRLYAREAASSMHAYCVGVLHLSEGESYLRIAVARATRRHPRLLDMLADGRLHLSGVERLAPHLTSDNRDDLLKRAIHRSKRQIEELVAELRPQPDVPSTVRKLPARSTRQYPSPGAEETRAELRPDGVGPSTEPQPLLRPDGAVVSNRSPELRPLAPSRYKVQFTASTELKDKLTRLQALLRTSVPDGDLAAIIEQAVTEKLDRLEARRFGKTPAPRKTLAATDTSAPSRYIPATVRRVVHERDGGRCRYVDPRGRRCQAHHRLEFHHDDKPFGRGGDHRPSNIKLMCRTHNTLLAEEFYGKDWMDRFRELGSRESRARDPG